MSHLKQRAEGMKIPLPVRPHRVAKERTRPSWANQEDNLPPQSVESIHAILDQAVWEPDPNAFKAIGMAIILQAAKDFGFTKNEVMQAINNAPAMEGR